MASTEKGKILQIVIQEDGYVEITEGRFTDKNIYSLLFKNAKNIIFTGENNINILTNNSKKEECKIF